MLEPSSAPSHSDTTAVFQVTPPSPPLREFVEALIYYEGLDPAHTLDRFLPNGDSELLINLTEQPQDIHHNDTLQVVQSCRRSWVSGVRTRPITIPSGRGSTMLIVIFKKGMAFPFYDFPMNEVSDRVVEGDLVFGTLAERLREELLDSASNAQMFASAERFLLRASKDRLNLNTADRCVRWAAMKMVHTPGITLSELSSETGYSHKHFIHLFRERVGVTPKEYLDIARFQGVLRDVSVAERVRWGELAARHGYSDQSHLIHRFRDFAGFTPGEYLARRGYSQDYVPVV